MKLKFQLSFDDVMAARRLVIWRRRAWVCGPYTAFGVLLFLFGVLNWATGGTDISFTVVPSVCGLFGALFYTVIAPFLAARRLLKTRKRVIVMGVAWTPEEVVFAGRLSSSTYRWQAVSDFLEGPTVWLLFVNPTAYQIIPTRAFESEAAKADFRAHLVRANPKFAAG